MNTLRSSPKTFSQAMKIVRMYKNQAKKGQIVIHSMVLEQYTEDLVWSNKVKSGKNRGKRQDITAYKVSVDFEVL